MNNNFRDLLTVKYHNYNYWENAAQDVVQKIFKFETTCGFSYLSSIVEDVFNVLEVNPYIKKHTFITSNQISMCKSVIDFYVENKLYLADPAEMRHTSPTMTIDQAVQANEAMFLILSHCAISLYEEMKTRPEYRDMLKTPMNFDYISSTVIKKQHDYGPNNIAKFGLYGLIIRMHDKIARLENLMDSRRGGINAVNNESVFDTLTDIVGYSTVAMMWIYGYFLLPMEMDNKAA